MQPRHFETFTWRTAALISRVFSPQRVATAVFTILVVASLMLWEWTASLSVLFGRLSIVAFAALLVFGVLETKPRALPRGVARWALRTVAVALSVPVGALVAYLLVDGGSDVPFWKDGRRITGFIHLSVLGVVFAPWAAITAMIREIGDRERSQALAFELERSELAREALDVRLRLMQAQVEPHFIFNTLANIRELVSPASALATEVLDNLIVYLRATVSSLHSQEQTVAQEIGLVRAYLEVMRLRIPDRLRFDVHVDDGALGLECPPMTILTLVENAVRHGIDPTARGGRVEVTVTSVSERCRIVVLDTGSGLGKRPLNLGTGLTTLIARLQLTFGPTAQLSVKANAPRGVVATVEYPARVPACPPPPP